MATVFGRQPRLPITQQAVSALNTAREAILPTPANDQAAMAQGLMPIKLPSGKTTYFDPMGGAGAIRRVGAQAARRVLPQVAKQIESSVVQIVNPRTSELSFMRIPKGALKAFHAAIDDTERGIAGIPDAKGNIYHLTAKSPEQMIERGFKDMGMADIGAIPRRVQEHARSTAPKVRDYIRTQARRMSSMGGGG